MIFFALMIVIAAMVWAWLTTTNNQPPHSTTQRTDKQPISVAKTPSFPNQEIAQQTETIAEKHTRIKGNIGEQLIKIKILENLKPPQYYTFHNLIVPNQQVTTQIDHIIVSPFGIFVVEAKYFAGWIYGKMTDKQWTHTLNRNSKYKFTNPLHQNYAHIKALMNILALHDENLFHSVVAFTHRECQIKTDLPNNVCLLNDFIPFIQNHTQEMLSTHQIETICRILSQSDWVATPERIEQHIQSLNNRFGKN